MELLTLSVFCALLLLCVLLDLPVLIALAAGLVLFLLYGRRKGFSWPELIRLALSGVRTVKNILITFVLIGILTALWRDAGTLAVIVCYAARVIRPSVFLLMTFLLNCLVSVLTGTSFGTAATMGVICATIAAPMGISPVLIGGAVLSGIYFGDRCSPVSTSALLVAELTKTNIFQNIKGMVRTAMVPFLLTCLIYGLVGFFFGGDGEIMDLESLFGREFTLHFVCLLPAAVVLLLSIMQINVKIAMTASILTALPICLFVQHTPFPELLRLIISGYRASDAQVAAMLNGGGILSMVNVGAIILLSSSYSDIFRETGLLDQEREMLNRLAGRTTSFFAILCTAVVTGMISFSQTLCTILTYQLCGQTEPDSARLAMALENTTILVAAMVPWSIAGAVPLAAIGTPLASIAFACYLYLVPAWQLIVETLRKRRLNACGRHII